MVTLWNPIKTVDKSPTTDPPLLRCITTKRCFSGQTTTRGNLLPFNRHRVNDEITRYTEFEMRGWAVTFQTRG